MSDSSIGSSSTRPPKEIRGIADLMAAAKEAVKQCGHAVFYRGHSDADNYKLIPGVYRGGYTPDQERNMAANFLLEAPLRCHSAPPTQDACRWLTLMRHYGLPTRLLDWTQSILVAAFFAVCHERNHKVPGAIWALSPSGMNDRLLGVPGTVVLDHPKVMPLVHDAFGVGTPAKGIKGAAVRPFVIDQRMFVQRACFTIHARPEPPTPPEALDQVLRETKHLTQFLIPADAKRNLLEELETLDITEAFLFPDLEHLGKAIADLTRPKNSAPGGG